MKNIHNALLLKQLLALKQFGYSFTDIAPSQLESNSLPLPNDLKSLHSIVNKCYLCELSKSRQKVVFGDGNMDADLMFIGESPEATEDNVGRPFIGRTGDLLTKMIENVLHIPRSQVYTTNIIKCRPPNNRVPTEAETLSCSPYLQKQIELIQPKVIVTLGTIAYKHLTGDSSSISSIRGNMIQMDKYRLIPTFHPSYLIRNPSAKKEVFSDLLKVKSLL